MAKNTLVKNIGTGDPALDLAANMVPGIRTRNVFGLNENIDMGASETIWNVGGFWVGPTAPQKFTVVSDDAADDAGSGQGAHRVRLFGLDSLRGEGITEDVVLDGTTPVDTEQDFAIVYFAMVVSHGTTGVNVGTLTITAKTDETTQQQIDPGTGSSRSAYFAVPEGQTLYITSYYASRRSKAAGELDIQLFVDAGAQVDLKSSSGTVRHEAAVGGSGNSYIQQWFNPYQEIVGPAVVTLRATSNSNGLSVSGGFDVITVDNTRMNQLRQARNIFTRGL